MSDTPNDRGGGETAPRELARVTLPQLYTVPPNERADVAKAIALAEQWSHAHGLRCTGAPNLRETCGGFAVVVFLLDKRLFATPCSAHADAVLAALRFAGRMRDVKFFPVQAYLEDAEPERAAKFVERAKAVADRNVRDGFSVPRAGPLL
jgi:hypothetical protein